MEAVALDFDTYAALHLHAIESRLERRLTFESDEPGKLHRAMRYSALGGGKRFRPLLCIASAEAVGGNREGVLDAACAIEMVHCFSLIHDDLPTLDNDDLRRGKPACHIAFGEAIALLAGDALFSLAFETLAEMECKADRRFLAMSRLAAASGTRGMVGGQTMDLESENKVVGVEAVEWIHARKTGALIAASCEIGAIVAGASEVHAKTCKEIGDEIGLAFQISDDVLNETGDESALGKRTQTDRERSKATYPAVLGIDKSMELASEAIERAKARIAGFEAAGLGLAALADYTGRRQS